ncbi:ubiquitin-conjugating enzyme E2-binding protein [Sporodiniella umbellata]|nr:ubiquitin-conjugating enzyme E2-binding protein [Sporodiniella umbellata]
MNSFYAEELGNIGILRATISTSDKLNLAESLEIKDNVITSNSVKIADMSTIGLAISNENLVISQANNSEADVKTWEVKICLADKTQKMRSQQTEAKEWWNTTYLKNRIEENDAFICKMCEMPLFKLEKDHKLKDLPSEHWYELIECWICHETNPDEHRSRMKPILARPKLVLVGSTYFLLYPENVLEESIELDEEVSKRLDWARGTITKWAAVNCKRCQHAVGEGQFNMEDGKMVLMSMKLFKYSISLLSKNCEPLSFVDLFVSDLVNTAKVHATHRFIIQGRQSTRNFALIWLFNWDTNIVYHDTTHTLTKKRVMKIMYLDCVYKKDGSTSAILDMWATDKSTEHLIYPDIYCKELLTTLKDSTLLLPPFMRKIDHPAMKFTKNFAVGFVGRRS